MSRDDYIEVSERVRQFLDKYPEGSLQSEWQYVDRDGEQWLVVRAYAYRHSMDMRPGVGHAWEPVPGRTPYTKGSELMVGETSAWGRATAALGIAVNRGIATSNEISAAKGRQADPVQAAADSMSTYRTPSGGHRQEGHNPATPKQIGMLKGTMSKMHISEALLADYCTQHLGFELPQDGLSALSKAQASAIIDSLLKQQTPAVSRTSTPMAEDDPWAHLPIPTEPP